MRKPPGNPWHVKRAIVPAGTLHPMQEELQFDVLYCVTSVRRFRMKIVPLLNTLVQSNGITPISIVATRLSERYGEEHAHVIALVKGPDENMEIVNAAISFIRKRLQGKKKKPVTILFESDLFALLTSALNRAATQWN